MNKKKLLYLTAGSDRHGYGHIRRSMELVKTLEKVFDVAFYAHWERHDESESMMDMSDISRVRKIEEPFIEAACQGILIDMPRDYAAQALEFYARKMSDVPLIALGCFLRVWNKPDVVINLDDMGESSACPKSHVGLQYSIIRDTFFPFNRKAAVRKDGRRVVISLGGADVTGLSESLVAILDNQIGAGRNIQFHLIVGPFSEKKDYHRDAFNLTVHRSPANIEEIMSEADVAICNGGTMMMEYAFLGIPVIAVPQTPHEEIFVRKFAHAGAALLVQSAQIKEKLSAALLDLLASEERRAAMSSCGQRMSDGYGKERIADIICGVI